MTLQALLLGILFALGGSLAEQTQPPVASAAAVSPESKAKLQAAFARLYNLDFAAARDLFSQVIVAERESATARAFLASALLYEILAHQGTLQSQLFVTSNEFLHERRLPPDPELKHRFQQVVEEAQQVAHQRLGKNAADPDALFALGLTYGTLADYAAGVEARYFYGLRLGEKAYDYHQELRQLYPGIEDAGVVLGVHDYVLGSLPRVQRFLLFFFGAGGDRQRGLQHLEGAAERSEFLGTYARVLLAVALVRERQMERATLVFERLRADYPRNPLILLELARLYREQQRYAEAAHLCQGLLAALTAHPPTPRILGPEDALLELARVEAAAGQRDAALESLRRIQQVPAADKKVLAWALLEEGRIFDLRGERERALAQYENVIRLASDPEAVRLARAYKKESYRQVSGSHR